MITRSARTNSNFLRGLPSSSRCHRPVVVISNIIRKQERKVKMAAQKQRQQLADHEALAKLMGSHDPVMQKAQDAPTSKLRRAVEFTKSLLRRPVW